jgi:hypothetical protein
MGTCAFSIAPMYEEAECWARSGERESCDSRGASFGVFGSGDCWRFQKPRKGILGVVSLLLVVLGRAGDCEYIDDPLTMDRTLVFHAPNLDGDCVGGVAKEASRSWFWSGRGDQAKSGDRNMV